MPTGPGCLPARPETTNQPPTAASSVPMTARRFDVAERSIAASRSASIGATLAALRAGRYAATTVTTTPTTPASDEAGGDDDRAGARQLQAEALEHRPQTLGRAETGEHADRRGDDAGEEAPRPSPHG